MNSLVLHQQRKRKERKGNTNPMKLTLYFLYLLLFSLYNLLYCTPIIPKFSPIPRLSSISEIFPPTSNYLVDNVILFEYKACSRELIQWNDLNQQYLYLDSSKKYFMSEELSLQFYHQRDDSEEKNSTAKSSFRGCVAVFLPVGTSREYITDVLPSYIFTRRDNFTQWHHLCQNVELGILSQYTEPVIVYSIHPHTNKRISSYKLQPGNLIWSTVHHCSKMEVTFVNKTLLLTHNACTSGIVVLNRTNYVTPFPYKVPVEAINASLNSQWNQSRSVVRTFTEFGFEKVRLPSGLWNSISTYYRNNYQSLSIDYSQLENFHTANWWNSSTLPLQRIEIPPILGKYWSQLLCQYVEMWSQGASSPFSQVRQKLQLTSSTGLRVYSENSYQLPHVENKSHTAFTVVINVDQTELLQPWVTQLYDFSGRLHEVVMFPGDILVYESATILYGRMVPLRGTKYVDLMFHYRPLQPELWYLEKNPNDAVSPLGEVTDCHEEISQLIQPENPSGDSAEMSISTTLCTEVKTRKIVDLPFLSPSRLKIQSGADLYEYWFSFHGESRNE